MADDLTREAVENELHEDIDFYDKEINRRADDVENMQDRVHLERLQREREKRLIALRNSRRSNY